MDLVFAKHDASTELNTLCVDAIIAANAAAMRDVATPAAKRAGTSDANGRIVLDDAGRGLLESWLASYDHDEKVLAALSDDDRQAVLDAAWTAYRLAVRTAYDREAA